ncbi:protoporphyrinogen oxidase [Oligoflexia bacterium]|nr:protoporphyrinogen oxidase [Oligoflexia bacterium]
MYDSIVIGGGISGLACAHRLVKSGEKIALLEPERLGGVIRSVKKDGFTLEQGPNVLLGKEALVDFINEIGVQDKIAYPAFKRLKQYVWYQGRPTQIPMSPPALITTPILSPLSKLQVAYKIVSCYKAKLTANDISVADFFTKLLNGEVVKNIVSPALGGIYGGDVTALSARSIFPRFWSGIREHGSLLNFLRKSTKKKVRPKTITFFGGLSTLVEAVQARLESHCDMIEEKATAISKQNGSFQVTLSNGKTVEAEKLFLATSGPATAQYIENLSGSLSRSLAALKFAPLVVVHVAVPRDTELPDNAFGVLFPDQANSKLIGVMFNSLMFPHTAPPDRHLFTVCLGGTKHRDIYEKPESEILKIVEQELLEKFKVHDPQVLEFCTWERAIPQYEVGHYKLVEEIRAVEHDYPGLCFCGVDLGGVGISDRVQMGYGALDQVSVNREPVQSTAVAQNV